jgi:hypothetical protein
MSDIRPRVIPTKEQMDSVDKKLAFEAEKLKAIKEIYTAPLELLDTPDEHKKSLLMMQERTIKQLEDKKNNGIVIDPDLVEKEEITGNRFVTQQYNNEIKIRDEQIAKNIELTRKYNQLAEEKAEINRKLIEDRKYNENINKQNMLENKQQTILQPNNKGSDIKSADINPYIFEISQPNYNSPFDIIPLPSQGKTYRNKKANVRIGYMTTADENILTSPNLLQSGEFLSVLINRKILEPDLRYDDLLVGDRNAIMLWLRATGYGEMYPVTLLDENGIAFDTELNLNELKTKTLNVDPDDEGLFSYTFNLCKAHIKFKLLTCGEVDRITALIAAEKENNIIVDNTSIYMLETSIIEVNGSRDRNYIKDFVNSIRIKDGKDFNEHLESLESGIDLNITVGTPGGGSVDTFLPLNLGFFWPNLRL